MINGFPDPISVYFWENRMSPILASLKEKAYQFPEVTGVFHTLADQIFHRYKQSWQNALVDESPSHIVTTNQSRTPLSVNCFRGVPTISIYIPEWMRMSAEVSIFEGAFEDSFVIGYLHELIHLANGWIPESGKAIDRERMHNSERLTWAKTCQDVIALFAKRNRILMRTEHELYCAWLQCGCNADSPEWTEIITNYYKHVHFIE